MKTIAILSVLLLCAGCKRSRSEDISRLLALYAPGIHLDMKVVDALSQVPTLRPIEGWGYLTPASSEGRSFGFQTSASLGAHASTRHRVSVVHFFAATPGAEAVRRKTEEVLGIAASIGCAGPESQIDVFYWYLPHYTVAVTSNSTPATGAPALHGVIATGRWILDERVPSFRKGTCR